MGAIGLNPIRLDRIGLDPIRINAIRLGVPGAASGSDRPYIDPEVLASLKAVCICYGKSNDDPDRAIVKNLVDPDNPFIISNAAYKLNSGYGKYDIDFTIFTNKFNVDSLDAFKVILDGGGSLFRPYSTLTENYPSWKGKVTFNNSNFTGTLTYDYRDNSGKEQKLTITQDGIYQFPICYNTETGDGTFTGLFNRTNSAVTIEQIPSYQGAFVTDGVDDLITSTKTIGQMVGENGDYTIISMIHQISYTHESAGDYDFALTNYIRSGDGYTRSRVTNIGKTAIYGYYANPKNSDAPTYNNILGDKADLFSETNAMPTIYNDKISIQGHVRFDGLMGEFSELAWYWTIFAKGQLTTDQINQVIAYYNLDRCVEPTVLYDVKRQGLSNDTPDSDWYLKDYSGNGYDMILYNYAKTPESGINEGGGLQSDGVDDFGKAIGLPVYKDYTVIADRELFNVTGCVLSNDNPGAFIFETSSASAYSFGEATSSLTIPTDKQIRYQAKYSYNGQNISIGAVKEGTSNMWLGTIRDNDARFRSAAIYSLMTFPYSMSEFLIERQLKKHKLGTLYPDMVEWRPIYTSNVNDYTITKATYFDETGQHDLALGNHYPIGTRFRIYVKPSGAVDEVTSIKVNGVELTYDYIDSNYGYAFNGTLSSKSPQKIDITIDEYIRYEDIVQPYPSLFTLIDYDTEEVYSWGSKLKVGTKFTGEVINLLPGMYQWDGDVLYNGEILNWGINPGIVAKEMAFSWSKSFKYLFDNNAPKCILSPSRLRIPNSSYKILGYIPDISGHGNHGVIHNSAYALNSGANGYPYDYSSSSFTVNTNLARKLNGEKVEYFAIGVSEGFIYNDKTYKGKVKITGVSKAISNNEIYNFRIYSNTSEHIESSEYITITEDGIYDIDIKGTSQDASKVNFFAVTKFSGVVKLETPITIEQVGEYEGAYCLDGVDDFITIPTTVGGKQVLLKCVWDSTCYGNLLYDQRTVGVTGSSAILVVGEDSSGEDSKIAYYARNANGKTYIDGILNEYIHCNSLIDKVHNITITNPDDNDRRPVIGASNRISPDFFSSVKFYDFMLFDEISTDEEILTLNEYVGIEGNTDDLFTENN